MVILQQPRIVQSWISSGNRLRAVFLPATIDKGPQSKWPGGLRATIRADFNRNFVN
jgi:hypothetical protein